MRLGFCRGLFLGIVFAGATNEMQGLHLQRSKLWHMKCKGRLRIMESFTHRLGSVFVVSVLAKLVT